MQCNLFSPPLVSLPTAYLAGADSGYYANFIRGQKFFELTNHLGNVLTTVTDKKLGVYNGSGVLNYFSADIVNASDYYPGGMTMPGRSFTASSANYRYGFNGKEKDNEVKGDGNQYDYGLRIYDPRAVRFLSVDPLTKSYPQLTPYQFASNSPIANIDLDGGEAKYYNVYTTDISFYGKNTKLNATSHEDVARNAGLHWNGIVPSYTKQGNLGAGTLYTIYHRQVDIRWDDKQGKTVQTESMVQVGSMYVPPPPKPTPGRPVSSMPFNIMLFGSGGDPSAAPADKPNPNATIVTLNFKEFMSIMDLSMTGMNTYDFKLDTKSLPGLADKLRKLKQYQKDNPETNNNNTSTENYPKPGIKPGDVVNFGTTNERKINDSTWETTSDPATDTSPVWKGYQKKD